MSETKVEKDDLFKGFAVGGEDGVVHLLLDFGGEFVDAGLGFGERGFGAEEVELDLSTAGEDGGVDVGVLLVDRRGAGVDLRLGDERHTEHSGGEMEWREGSAEKWDYLLGEEGLEFFGWPRQKDDDAADACFIGVEEGGVQILAGRAAVLVVEDGWRR